MKRFLFCLSFLVMLLGCQTTTTPSLEETSTGMYVFYRQQVYLHFKDLTLDEFTLDVFWVEEQGTVPFDSQLERLCQATLSPLVTDWDTLLFLPGSAQFSVKARWIWTKNDEVVTIEYQLSGQDIYYLVITYQNQEMVTHSATLVGDSIPRNLLDTLTPVS